MPNLPAHIDLACQVAQRLDHPALRAHMGCFLLGSTSPDIRVITRRSREEYHFAGLDFDEPGAGVAGLFSSYPDLARSDGPTRAFVAGYITHIVADEAWIVGMYRRYFGNADVFPDVALGNVMDRALQLELDRQAWDTAVSWSPALKSAPDGVTVPFIPAETLMEWRDWVLAFIERGFSWDRLRFMARRISAGDDLHPAHSLADEFLRSFPDSLEHLFKVVPACELGHYKQQSIEALVGAVGDYLS